MELDITAFRAEYPEFSDESLYPDATLEAQYEIGKCYIKDNNCVLPEKCRAHALNLMLAQLLYIKTMISSGNSAKIVTSATEGAVSVSLAEPPSANNFEYWLNSTPYGPQILSMLEVASAGGFYVGPSLDRAAFRGANGRFR